MPPAGNDMITTDKLRFRQIFTNLMDNAIKFTENGSISIGFHSFTEDLVTCFVADTGIGISGEFTKVVFDMFRQVDSQKYKILGGTGLGLAICRGNAILLGGNIRVESEPDKGSTFYFSVKNQTTVQIKAPDKKEPDKRLKRTLLNVFLIEDDENTIEYVKGVLKTLPIILHIAETGEKARQYYNRLEKIDIVLLDVKLSDMNGLDLAREIKAIKKEVVIIAQSAFAMETDIKAGLGAGCDDYLTKPYLPEELIKKINHYA
jgi:CheY-like chemotaxis protein